MKSKIKILVVDDHPIFRRGVIAMLEANPSFSIVGEAGSGSSALEIFLELRKSQQDVDLVLMDVQMSTRKDGVLSTREFRALPSPPTVLLLTTFEDDETIQEAIAAGASGYLLKDAPEHEVFKAIESAAVGNLVFGPAVATRLARIAAHPPIPADSLSGRERELLSWLARGFSNREIAKELYISEATVKSHLVKVYEKLKVRSRVDAVLEAQRRNLV